MDITGKSNLVGISMGSNSLGRAPVYDSFYSPKNQIFYQQSLYKTLDPAKHQIRLLRLDPLDNDGVLSFSLLDNCPLDEVRSRYTALSYCAGNPHTTQAIRVNGANFNAFANLGYALEEVVAYWKKNGKKMDEELLWADQICINQSDPGERSHQVLQMRDIYASAKIVLISLATKDTGLGSASAVGWIIQPREKLQDMNCKGTRDTLKSPCRSGMTLFIIGNFLHSSFQDGLVAFFQLLRSPWWTRAWIYQEFVVASEAVFLFGRASISWQDFAIVMQHIAYIPVVLSNAYSRARRRQWSDQLFSNKLYQPNDSLDDKNLLELVFALIKQKVDWKKEPAGLKSWLECGRRCQTSDPRDRVYAFLGLAHPQYNIVPDYSRWNSMREILLEVAKKIVIAENTMELLLYAGGTQTKPMPIGFPSWVPSWDPVALHRVDPDYQETAGRITRPEIPLALISIELNETVLRVEGIRIDTILSRISRSGEFPSKCLTTRGLLLQWKWWSGSLEGSCLWVFPGVSVGFILRPERDGWVLLFNSKATLGVRLREFERWAADVARLIQDGDYVGLLAAEGLRKEIIKIY